MQATARRLSVVSSTLPARRRLIRDVLPKMKRSVKENLADVSFHDSTIERFERVGDAIILTFDWAKVTYENTSLVVGQCYLHLIRVVSDEIIPKEKSTECIGMEFSLVGTNSSESDKDLVLGGFYESAPEYSWVEWRCRFDSFELQWESDVTLEEWRAGKLPEAEQAVRCNRR
jgi:hypothetical protein